MYVVNRSLEASEVTLELQSGSFTGTGMAYTVNGTDIKAANTFDTPDNVGTTETSVQAEGQRFSAALEPHSFTAFTFELN